MRLSVNIYCNDCHTDLGSVSEAGEATPRVEAHREECRGPVRCPVCNERVDLHTMDDAKPPRIYCPPSLEELTR